MYKCLLLAAVSLGLTACDGGTDSNIKAPTLKPGEIKAINALASGVNRDYDWKATSSSENKADADDIVSAVKFSMDKPFNIDRVEADFTTETHKIFTYEWHTFEPIGDDKYSKEDETHTLEVGIPGLATAQGKLKDLLSKENLSQEDQIKKAVYKNFALPMALGANEFGAYRSFNKLTSEPIPDNNGQPLCSPLPSGDLGMSCTIPAQLSVFNEKTTITLEQQTGEEGKPFYYKTNSGDVYEAYKFIQIIEVHGTDSDEMFSADVLIHPGIGIISMELPVIKDSNDNGIQTTQTKWEWFNDNPNVLEQDMY
ncbi:hypothetical protein [Vibrio halioticoli]|nr:hypothetical protein [Vibrio halioticoli]